MTENTPMMDASVAGLITFLDWAAEKGEMAPNTAASYKTAITKLFEIDGEAWRSTQIKDVDLERQFDRFTRLRLGLYNPKSLQSYRDRSKLAILHYLKFLEDPPAFRTPQQRSGQAKRAAKPQQNTSSTKSQGVAQKYLEIDSSKAPERAELIQYPFPLREGEMAYISLPRDLRSLEARRIAGFISSLAMDIEVDHQDPKAGNP